MKRTNTDYYEHDAAAKGSFVAGLFFGAAVGAAAALLFAPRSGREMREQIADSASGVGRRAREGYDSARDAYDRTSDRVTELVDKANTWVSDMKSSVKDKADAARERASAMREQAEEKAQSWMNTPVS